MQKKTKKTFVLLSAVFTAVFVFRAFAADVRQKTVIRGPFDMRASMGAEFRFACDNPENVRRGFVYFKSGQGAYKVPFNAGAAGGEPVKVLRSGCSGAEGKVEGWKNISHVTISFWHDEAKPVEWSVSGFRIVNAPYDAVVVTPSAPHHTIVPRLEACGLKTILVPACDLDDGVLAPASLLVPIGGGRYPDSATGAMERHVSRGGKTLSHEERLKASTHRLLFGCLERLLPENGGIAKMRIAERERRRREILAAREFPDFMRAGGDGEYRDIACHTAYGPEYMDGDPRWEDWDANCATLKSLGFNALCVNVARGGIAFYDSKVLPVAPEVAAKGDSVDLISKACRKHGMRFVAWKVCLHSRRGMMTPQFEKWIADGRGVVNFDGTRDVTTLCPSRPENRALEVESIVELAKRGPWAVSMDYIRYPSADSCFCDCCRKGFEKALGKVVADWPRAVRSNKALLARWERFRRDTITSIVRETSKRVRAEAPGVGLRASVYRRHDENALKVAQDWAAWCDEGLLDGISPMNGMGGAFVLDGMEALVGRQRAAAGSVKLAPTYYPSLWDGCRNASDLMKIIGMNRKAAVQGFSIFRFDRRIVEMLCAGEDSSR